MKTENTNIDLDLTKKLGDLVVYSLSQKTGLKRLSLGKEFYNLKGSEHIEFFIDSYSIRHAFKKHGVKSKNDLPICVFDILLLPTILRNGHVVRTDDQALVVSKNKFGLIGEIVFEFISSTRKGNKYHLKTMYNKKRAVKPF